MSLREIRDAVRQRYPDLPGKQKIALIKDLDQRERDAVRDGKTFSLDEELGPMPAPVNQPTTAPAVRVIPQHAQARAEEISRKQGLTFGDLCALVDKGRELGIDATAPVLGDQWLGNRIQERQGYRVKWLEI